MRLGFLALLLFTAVAAAGCVPAGLRCIAIYLPNPDCNSNATVPPPPTAPPVAPIRATWTGGWATGIQSGPINYASRNQAATITALGPADNPTQGQPYTFAVVGNPCVTLSQSTGASVVATSAASGSCALTITNTTGQALVMNAVVP